jgi:hypothetical protein
VETGRTNPASRHTVLLKEPKLCGLNRKKSDDLHLKQQKAENNGDVF